MHISVTTGCSGASPSPRFPLQNDLLAPDTRPASILSQYGSSQLEHPCISIWTFLRGNLYQSFITSIVSL